jgi:hypothetical protein
MLGLVGVDRQYGSGTDFSFNFYIDFLLSIKVSCV